MVVAQEVGTDMTKRECRCSSFRNSATSLPTTFTQKVSSGDTLAPTLWHRTPPPEARQALWPSQCAGGQRPTFPPIGGSSPVVGWQWQGTVRSLRPTEG
jgi:hypothetical protein